MNELVVCMSPNDHLRYKLARNGEAANPRPANGGENSIFANVMPSYYTTKASSGFLIML